MKNDSIVGYKAIDFLEQHTTKEKAQEILGQLGNDFSGVLMGGILILFLDNTSKVLKEMTEKNQR